MKRNLNRTTAMVRSAAALVSFFALLASAEPLLAEISPIRFEARSPSPGKSRSREAGTIYLEDFTDWEVKVTIERPVGIYTTLSGATWLGNLLPAQHATLLAVSDRAYRVRGLARQGHVVGWVGKYAVSGVSEEMIESLEALNARKMMVDELISKHQVAMGMTIGEVQASIGSPAQRRSRTDSGGRIDVYEYVTYDRVPHIVTSFDPCGCPVRTTVWIKVETGRMTITFEDGIVSAIEKGEGGNFATESGRIVPPPIFSF